MSALSINTYIQRVKEPKDTTWSASYSTSLDRHWVLAKHDNGQRYFVEEAAIDQ